MRTLNHRSALMLFLLGATIWCLFILNTQRRDLWGQESVHEVSDAVVALKGFDAIALTNGKEVPGDQSIHLDRNGFRYFFATDENRKQFESEPSRYEIQLNGQCGAMPGEKGDPGLFAVVNSRIYIFGTPSCRTAFTADPETFLKPPKNVAIFVHEGVELLDFAGPAEVFAAADHGRAFNVYTVAVSENEITSQGFLKIKPQYTLNNCPHPDVIVLPGGNTSIPLGDAQVIQWIGKSSADAEIVMSVCTGAFLLAKAGLLDDKEATTHWGSIEGACRKRHRKQKFTRIGESWIMAGS